MQCLPVYLLFSLTVTASANINCRGRHHRCQPLQMGDCCTGLSCIRSDIGGFRCDSRGCIRLGENCKLHGDRRCCRGTCRMTDANGRLCL